ncbi:MAG: ATP-binding protein [Lachnospiraceae bacterium]|nr:ATP-binding protein [Lachnospiraceae bacterium]
MKSILYVKFAILYIIFGFISLFTIATLSDTLIQSRFQQDTSHTLFRNAALISGTYLPAYFSGNLELNAINHQFGIMAIYLDSYIWFVEPDGSMITSAGHSGGSAPDYIEHFNPAEIHGRQYMIGNYHGHFQEDVITVIAPVTQSFEIKGYILLHMPFQNIIHRTNVVLNYIYITMGVIYLFSFLILMGFHLLIYMPLRNVTEAATQYAQGNLEYEIPVRTTDEMGYLSASLNYMSTQLKDMEDYQKLIVANVSHDFRSPLTSIKGYVEAMTDGTIPSELHEKYLKIILFETKRLTDLTTDLLTLNEIDNRDFLLNKIDFDIQASIKQVAASFEGICKNKRISIELLFLEDYVSVYADRGKIQQVLYNLIDNAIKFSEANSNITIEVREKNEKVFVSVKDYGLGIPRKELNKVWERFYKSDLSRGKDKKGTGLGLAIVREIMQAHDENINLISTEGVGSEFTFSLHKS